MNSRKRLEFRNALEEKRRALEVIISNRFINLRNSFESQQINKVGDDADRSLHNSEEDTSLLIAQMDSMNLDQVNRVLAKIDDGTYGICSDCREEISEIRLRAIPWTDKCIDCKKKDETITNAVKTRYSESRFTYSREDS